MFNKKNIVLRFSVLSDIHIGIKYSTNDDKFKNALIKSVKLAGGEEKLDLVTVSGDIFDASPDKEAPKVKKILDETINPDFTELILAVGNHDAYFDKAFEGDNNKFRDAFTEYVYKNPVDYYLSDYHTVVKGFHFISVFGIDYDHCQNHLDWLDKQLEIASSETKDKPIFVFTHVPPANTCGGSFFEGRWQSTNIGDVLKKYPQSVIFSGHTHFDAKTPDAVWQGEYTSVNSGTCADSMHFFEVDKDGKMRMSTYTTSVKISKMKRAGKSRVFTIPTVASN